MNESASMGNGAKNGSAPLASIQDAKRVPHMQDEPVVHQCCGSR